MRVRILSIGSAEGTGMRFALRVAYFTVFCVALGVVGLLSWNAGLHPDPNAIGGAGVVCGPDGQPLAGLETGSQAVANTDAGASLSPLAFFTGGGHYMPRVHCLVNEAGTTDWPWVFVLLLLNGLVIAGYTKIFVFWRRAYLAERPEDRNKKLMDLAWIFALCAACGYAASIMVFVWPAYRLVALILVPLAVFTWKFCRNLDEMQVSLSAKRLERELQEALVARTEQLEAEVAARTAELREARDAERAANAAKSAFIATVSHEIRTPLNAIMGYSGLLADDALDARVREEYAGIVSRNGEHLATVIDDVLDLSKIESQRLMIERVPCCIGTIVNDVAMLMRPRAEERGVELTCSATGPIPDRVIADPTRIRQVLLNLVSNAVKFTERGSVWIRVNTEEDGGAGRLILEVADTGIGMSPEQCEQVFEPFRQAEPGTTRRFGGTGLGLTISRSLCELMGGSLRVSSVEGEGSVFTAECAVTVPAEARWSRRLESARSADEERETAPALRGRVLITDDSVDNRRLLRVFLQKMGLACEEAEDGLVAIQKIERADAEGEPFDIVLMDLDMPRCDGETAMKRLRGPFPDLPIVALTAHTTSGIRKQLLARGFDDYASKPIKREALRDLCEKWLGNNARRAA